MGNAAAQKRARPGTVDRRRRLLRRGAARAAVLALSGRRRRVRARHDLAPRRVARRRRLRRRPRRFGHRRRAPVRRRPADAPRAALPGLGADLDGLQLDLRVLHRPGGARPRGQPASRRGPRRGDTPGTGGRPRAHAARPERQLVGARPAARTSHTEFGELLRACDAVDGIERIRFTSPHPKDFRRPVIEAMAECAAVCEHAHLPLQSGSTRILKAMRRTYSPRALPPARRRAARRDPRPCARDGHHRRLSGRDRGRLPGDARGRRRSRLRHRLHVRLLAARGHRGGGDARPGSGRGQARPDRAARGASSSAAPPSGTPSADRPRRGGARRGPEPDGRRLLRGRTRRNTTVNFTGDAAPGDFVDVRIERATSTTLGGSQIAVAVA